MRLPETHMHTFNLSRELNCNSTARKYKGIEYILLYISILSDTKIGNYERTGWQLSPWQPGLICEIHYSYFIYTITVQKPHALRRRGWARDQSLPRKFVGRCVFVFSYFVYTYSQVICIQLAIGHMCTGVHQPRRGHPQDDCCTKKKQTIAKLSLGKWFITTRLELTQSISVYHMRGRQVGERDCSFLMELEAGIGRY